MTPAVEGFFTEKTKALLFARLSLSITSPNDFGCIERDGIPKIYWKINYYEDETMEEGPKDLLNAYRVLIVMFAINQQFSIDWSATVSDRKLAK